MTYKFDKERKLENYGEGMLALTGSFCGIPGVGSAPEKYVRRHFGQCFQVHIEGLISMAGPYFWLDHTATSESDGKGWTGLFSRN